MNANASIDLGNCAGCGCRVVAGRDHYHYGRQYCSWECCDMNDPRDLAVIREVWNSAHDDIADLLEREGHVQLAARVRDLAYG